MNLCLRLRKTISRNTLCSISYMIGAMPVLGFSYFTSQYLQLVAGYSPMIVGFIMLPTSIVFFVSGLYVVRLTNYFNAKKIIVFSLFLNLFAYILLAIIGKGVNTVELMFIWSILGVGISYIETITYDLIIASVPEGKSAAAAAVAESIYELGFALGAALMGSVINWSYMNNFNLSAHIPSDDLSLVKTTLTEAIVYGQKQVALNPQLSQEVISSAKQAFLHSVPMIATVGIIFMVFSIYIAYKLLDKTKNK